MSGGPSGGKKDTAPPKVLKASPENKSIHFTGKKITIDFDEFIVLDNVFKEVIISPTLPKMPDISVKGKSLIVNFNDIKLDSNTTYSIMFGNSIKDYHEGNILKNYRYIFSTGDYLDSFSLSGVAINGLDHKPEAGKKVELYIKGYDSLIYKQRPLYYEKTDSFGKFALENLRKGDYDLYILDDKNDNYLLDPGESVGFPVSSVSLDSSMVLKDTMNMFPVFGTNIILKKAYYDGHLMQLRMDMPIDSVKIMDKSNGISYYSKSESGDSVSFWFDKDYKSADVRIYRSRVQLDTLIYAAKSSHLSKFAFNVNCTADNGNFYKTVVIIKSSLPLSYVNKRKILIFRNNKRMDSLKAEYLDSSHCLTGVVSNFLEDSSYKIVLAPGSLISARGDSVKDTAIYSVLIPGLKSYGNLGFKVKLKEGNYIVQLVNESGKVIFYKNVSRETFVKIPFVNPGTYRLRLIEDDNNNGRWDGGDVIKHEQPEKVYYYPVPLNIKANWELAGIIFDITGRQK